jgi:hypothetical protein
LCNFKFESQDRKRHVNTIVKNLWGSAIKIGKGKIISLRRKSISKYKTFWIIKLSHIACEIIGSIVMSAVKLSNDNKLCYALQQC